MARLSPEFTHRNGRLAALGFPPQGDCGSSMVSFDLTEPKWLQNGAPHDKLRIHTEDFDNRSPGDFYRYLSHRCAGHCK